MLRKVFNIKILLDLVDLVQTAVYTADVLPILWTLNKFINQTIQAEVSIREAREVSIAVGGIDLVEYLEAK